MAEFDVDFEYEKYTNYIRDVVNKDVTLPTFHKACIHGDHNSLKNILTNPNPDEPINQIINMNFLGLTPLHLACIMNRARLVDSLLGRNPNTKDVVLPYVDEMLNVRTTINTDEGATPLHLACLANNYSIVESLLATNANKSLTYNGKTPLEIATIGDAQSIVKIIENPPVPTRRPISLGGFSTRKNRKPKSRSRVRKTSKSRKRKVRNTRKNKL
jgi:hypothetical protein